MSRHNSHGGSLHWIPYISPTKDEKDFSRCSYYIDGFCIRDNQPCMESNYCKEYTCNAVVNLHKPSVNMVAIYTVEICAYEKYYEKKIYMTDYCIYYGKKELDYFSPLAQQFLKRPKVGGGFIYGDVKYTIKNFEIKKVNKISNS